MAEYWQNIKNGLIYEVICAATDVTNNNSVSVIVYRDTNDKNTTYVRTANEFYHKFVKASND